MNESYVKEKFKEFITSQGYRIEREFTTSSPDLLLNKDGKLIAVEIKGSRSTSNYALALGQLIFAIFNFKGISEAWLVLGKTPTRVSEKWLECLWCHGIKIYLMMQNRFELLTPERFRKFITRRSFEEIEENILTLLRENPSGITIEDITRMLNLEKQQVIDHVSGRLTRSLLKGKIIFDGNFVKIKDNL